MNKCIKQETREFESKDIKYLATLLWNNKGLLKDELLESILYPLETNTGINFPQERHFAQWRYLIDKYIHLRPDAELEEYNHYLE